MFKKLLILSTLLGVSSLCEARTYQGNHTVYFDMQNGKTIEVYYEGTYQYDYSIRKYKPKTGMYKFSSSCLNQYSCVTSYEAEKVMDGFQQAIKSQSLYTIEFSAPPIDCQPGQICNKPLGIDILDNEVETQRRGSAQRRPADNRTSISEDLKNLIDVAKGSNELYEAWFKSDDNAIVIIRKKDGVFKGACAVKKSNSSVLECEEITEASGTKYSFGGELQFRYDDQIERANYNAIFDWLEQNRTYSCETTMQCKTIPKQGTVCNVSYTCNRL